MLDSQRLLGFSVVFVRSCEDLEIFENFEDV